jgi:hypothetical protein
MKKPSFLATTEDRAGHLRELSHHIRSLDWTNASLRDVEHEIPELELAMSVYQRLNGEGGDAPDPDEAGAQDFRSLAETRVSHLRQLSVHLRALEWDHAALTEVEKEIPELELAMAVYRRLTGEADGIAARPPKPPAATGKSRAAAPPEPVPAPSFSQFALTHLDPVAASEATDRPLETVSTDPNGVKDPH